MKTVLREPEEKRKSFSISIANATWESVTDWRLVSRYSDRRSNSQSKAGLSNSQLKEDHFVYNCSMRCVEQPLQEKVYGCSVSATIKTNL